MFNGTCLYNVFTAQFIGICRLSGSRLRFIVTFGICTVFYPIYAFVIVAVVGVVIAASGED